MDANEWKLPSNLRVLRFLGSKHRSIACLAQRSTRQLADNNLVPVRLLFCRALQPLPGSTSVYLAVAAAVAAAAAAAASSSSSNSGGCGGGGSGVEGCSNSSRGVCSSLFNATLRVLFNPQPAFFKGGTARRGAVEVPFPFQVSFSLSKFK